MGYEGRTTTITSPVEGTVTAVNESVLRDPSLLHRDPYARGWVFAVAPKDERFRSLLHDEPARDWLSKEAERLAEVLYRDFGVQSDAAELQVPLPSRLTPQQWERLTGHFLRPQ